MPHTHLVLPAGRRRVDRFTRIIRAVWRDTTALWNEFQRPFTTFLLALFGGGALYGVLYNTVAQNTPAIPAWNLPYTMLALMVLETPHDVPEQPYLIIFWYALPAIALYVIGQGAVDFVRLFFDRSGRRTQWEEAVASTYRDHIIVVGIGHVGLRVVRALVGMGFEVVGISQDMDDETDDELNRLGVPVIVADARSRITLDKAGIGAAQSIVLATSDDYVNLQAAMRAREIRRDIRIVARMWDSTFARELSESMHVEAVLSASDLSAPAFAGAAVGIEVTQSMHINGVEYSMIRVLVAPGSFMDGHTVGELQVADEVDIVLHARKGVSRVHPPADVRIQAGDTLVVFAQHARILQLVTRNQTEQGRAG